jgi:hypothetical protein
MIPDVWTASVTVFHSVGQKEVRIIENLEPVISGHRLIVDRAAITALPEEEPHETLQYQLSRITRDRKALREDGKLDSLSSCVYKWEHILRNDTASTEPRFDEDRAIAAFQERLKSLGFEEDIDPASFLSRR